MSSATITPQHSARPFCSVSKYCRVSYRWLLGLIVLLLMPTIAHATCNSHDISLGNIASPSLTTPANHFYIGTQIGSWSTETSDATIFDVQSVPGVGGGCGFQGNWGAIDYGFADALGTPTGVIYTDPSNGKTYPVYATGVDDIGYVVGIRDYRATNLSTEIPLNVGTNQTYPTATLSGAVNVLGYRVRLLFIATGPLKGGNHTIPGTNVARLWARNAGNNYVPPAVYVTLPAVTITVKALGCVINAPKDQVIDMPTVAIGTTDLTQAEKYFEVGVMCDAGVALYATLTDMSNPSNTDTILRPNANSVAQGVGIQLFKKYESVPLAFGPDSSAAGNPNQWFVAGSASASATGYVIPFSARYVILPEYQVGATGYKGIKPGYFEAAASITFSYQ